MTVDYTGMNPKGQAVHNVAALREAVERAGTLNRDSHG